MRPTQILGPGNDEAVSQAASIVRAVAVVRAVRSMRVMSIAGAPMLTGAVA
jgi:hypothetical protein